MTKQVGSLAESEAHKAIFWTTPGCNKGAFDSDGFSAEEKSISACAVPHRGVKEQGHSVKCYSCNDFNSFFKRFSLQKNSLGSLFRNRSRPFLEMWNAVEYRKTESRDPTLPDDCKYMRPACLCGNSWSAGYLVGRAPDSWSKGCKFESRQERQENFLLQS